MNATSQEASAKNTDAFTVIRWFAFVLANGRVYGLDHKITQQSIGDAARAVQAYQQRHGALVFNIVDDTFQIEGVPLGTPIPSTTALARCLTTLQAQTLAFQADAGAGEVETFLKMLFVKENEVQSANGFANLLSASGLTHIRTEAYTYQRVADSETVVNKAMATQQGLSPEAVGEISRLLNDAEAPPGTPSAALRQIDLDNETVQQELARLTAPPDDVDSLGPAELTRQTMARLQRMSDELLDSPASRTQKGRRSIRRLIKAVETDVADRLQRLGADIQAVEQLASRVKELVEELAVDGLIAQFMKLQGEIAEKERKLKRHIRRAEQRGEDAESLKSRLVSSGLPAAVLEHLSQAARQGGTGSGGGDGSGGPGGAPAAGEGGGGVRPSATAPAHDGVSPPPDTPLADLLKRLRSTEPGDGTLPELVESILAEMKHTLQQTATRAEAQMETLKRIVMIPAGRPDNADLSRRQLLVLMAELGQELRQPLTVITGAIEMLLRDYFGTITPAQRPIVEMAADSSRDLDALIGRMIRIAGMPASLNPDEKILNRIK
jgi:hypothetical protein